MITLIVLSVVTGVLRVAGAKSQSFQAGAHILVGLLFGLIACGRTYPAAPLLQALTILEVACFARDHLRGKPSS